MYLVNFSNQIAAGPKNIANNFIRNALQDSENFVFIVPNLPEYLVHCDTHKCKFIVVNVFPGNIKALFNVFKVNIFLMNSLAKKYNPKAILSFGNFLFGINRDVKKVVLLHHPYIVDDRLYNNLATSAKLAERIKRFIFKTTVKEVDTVVVQSDYMEKLLLEKYKNDKFNTKVFFNPISDNFSKLAPNPREQLFVPPPIYNLLYVSRFYPHKNHEFILELAKYIKEKNLPIVINITVDETIGSAKSFITNIKSHNLPVVNLGELPQSELVYYYENHAYAAIFPSKSETFGNPLIEALFYSLPVIAPNLDYAKSILGDAGVIYQENSVCNCIDEILKMFDLDYYNQKCLKSMERASIFPSSRDWYFLYMNLLR